jgi:hypothetical protein
LLGKHSHFRGFSSADAESCPVPSLDGNFGNEPITSEPCGEPIRSKSSSHQTKEIVVMSRKLRRCFATLFMFAFAGWMIMLGNEGHVFTQSGMPVHYVGFFVGFVGVLATCGVNVWRGGPLDLRYDA